MSNLPHGSPDDFQEALEIHRRNYEEYLETQRRLQAEKEALEAQEEEEYFDLFSDPHYHALRVTKDKDVIVYEEWPLTHPVEAYLLATNIDMQETGVKHHAVVCWKTSCW